MTFTLLAESPTTQCFAVKIKLGAIMLPPQAKFPFICNNTCQGASDIFIGKSARNFLLCLQSLASNNQHYNK